MYRDLCFHNPSYFTIKKTYFLETKIHFRLVMKIDVHRNCVAYEVMVYRSLWAYFVFLHAAVHGTLNLISLQGSQLFNIALHSIDRPLYHLPGRFQQSQPVRYLCVLGRGSIWANRNARLFVPCTTLRRLVAKTSLLSMVCPPLQAEGCRSHYGSPRFWCTKRAQRVRHSHWSVSKARRW